MSTAFLRNLELWLTGAGLLVVWLTALLAPESVAVWKLATTVALVVSVIHGSLFWVVRRRQQRVRAQAIAEIREMMADRIKNQLAVIGMYAPMASDRDAFTMVLDGINESVGEIERVVDSISSESLGAWKRTYSKAIDNGVLEMG